MAQNPPVSDFQTAGPPLFTPPIPYPATKPPVGPDSQPAPASVTATTPVSSTVTIVYSVPNISPAIAPIYNPYLDYTIHTFYLQDTGLSAVGVGGPPGTATQIVRLNAGKQMKLVTWFCRRIGSPPVLPSKNTGSTNEVLIASCVSPGAAGNTPGRNAHLDCKRGLSVLAPDSLCRDGRSYRRHDAHQPSECHANGCFGKRMVPFSDCPHIQSQRRRRPKLHQLLGLPRPFPSRHPAL